MTSCSTEDVGGCIEEKGLAVKPDLLMYDVVLPHVGRVGVLVCTGSGGLCPWKAWSQEPALMGVTRGGS